MSSEYMSSNAKGKRSPRNERRSHQNRSRSRSRSRRSRKRSSDNNDTIPLSYSNADYSSVGKSAPQNYTPPRTTPADNQGNPGASSSSGASAHHPVIPPGSSTFPIPHPNRSNGNTNVLTTSAASDTNPSTVVVTPNFGGNPTPFQFAPAGQGFQNQFRQNANPDPKAAAYKSFNQSTAQAQFGHRPPPPSKSPPSVDALQPAAKHGSSSVNVGAGASASNNRTTGPRRAKAGHYMHVTYKGELVIKALPAASAMQWKSLQSMKQFLEVKHQLHAQLPAILAQQPQLAGALSHTSINLWSRVTINQQRDGAWKASIFFKNVPWSAQLGQLFDAFFTNPSVQNTTLPHAFVSKMQEERPIPTAVRRQR
jgi:hypothetical protein